MTNIGIIPGGVYEAVMKEHRALDDVVKILNLRVELDQKYLRHLEEICDHFRPEWASLDIYPLISPILKLFKHELIQRHAAYEAIESLLEIHPFVDSSMDNFEYEESSQCDEVPAMLYGQLVQANQDLAHSKQVAGSPDSVRDFWLWQNFKVSHFNESEEDYVDVRSLDEDQLATFLLPEADRNYRQCVHNQQQAVHKVWHLHMNVLPDLLDNHERRMESIQHVLRCFENQYCQLAYGMVQRISSTKEALAHFCPSRSAAIKHEMRHLESAHDYMRPAKYVNFVTGKSSPIVVYGLELPQIPFMRRLQHITERIVYRSKEEAVSMLHF